ncbi:MAG: hypothetical protein M3O31_03565 [Acidobacteriota bacterium]|nr:hypothetical protein [Acidobacteriota bacterium]
MLLLYKRQTGLFFLCMLVLWMLVDSGSTYFVFHGNPPLAMVAMKDILPALFVLGGGALKLSSSSALRWKLWHSSLRWFYALVLIAIVYFIVDIARAGDVAESVHGLRDFLAPFVVLLIGTTVGARPGFGARFFVDFIAAVFAIVMLFALYQYFAFSTDDLIKYAVIDPSNLGRLTAGFVQNDSSGLSLGTVRALGVFDSPLVLGIVSVMVICNSWVGFGWSKGPRRLLHCGVIALAILALGASYTRAAQIGLIVAILVLARSFARRGWLIGISLVAAILPFGLLRTFNGSNLDPSTVGHLLAYARALELLRVRPLGYGISFAGTRPTQTGFDGDYLNLLLNVGPFGLILFLAAFTHFYRQAKRLSSSRHLQTLSMAVRGMLISYCIAMIALMIQTNGGCRIIDLWIGVMLGFGTTYAKRCEMLKPVLREDGSSSSERRLALDSF